MPQVMIECPHTGQHVYAGLNFDWSTFECQKLPEMRLKCPACGEEHRWTKADAFLRADGGDG